MLDVKIGDEVRIFESYRRSQPGGYAGRVIRVGRTLFDVDCEASWLTGVYRLNDGHLNRKDSRTYARTLEQVALAERKVRAQAILTEHKVRLDSGHKLTLEQIEKLAEALASVDSDPS